MRGEGRVASVAFVVGGIIFHTNCYPAASRTGTLKVTFCDRPIREVTVNLVDDRNIEGAKKVCGRNLRVGSGCRRDQESGVRGSPIRRRRGHLREAREAAARLRVATEDRRTCWVAGAPVRGQRQSATTPVADTAAKSRCRRAHQVRMTPSTASPTALPRRGLPQTEVSAP